MVKYNHTVYRAEMALAATLLPSGSVRSVMARTALGLARAGSFTSSETCMHKQTYHCSTAVACLKQVERHHVAQVSSLKALVPQKCVCNQQDSTLE